MVIAGDNDVEAGAVSFRYRDGHQDNGVPVDEAIARVVEAVDHPGPGVSDPGGTGRHRRARGLRPALDPAPDGLRRAERSPDDRGLPVLRDARPPDEESLVVATGRALLRRAQPAPLQPGAPDGAAPTGTSPTRPSSTGGRGRRADHDDPARDAGAQAGQRPARVQRRAQPGGSGRRVTRRPPAPARRTPLVGRPELHHRRRRHQDPARSCSPTPARCWPRPGRTGSADQVGVLRRSSLEAEDRRVHHLPLADLDRPADGLVGVPGLRSAHHDAAGTAAGPRCSPRSPSSRGTTDCGPPRSSPRRPPTVNIGSSNVVGRAHSKPMPSSQDTSTIRLPRRNARGRPRSRNISGVAVSWSVQLTTMSFSARYPAERHPPAVGDHVAEVRRLGVVVELPDQHRWIGEPTAATPRLVSTATSWTPCALRAVTAPRGGRAEPDHHGTEASPVVAGGAGQLEGLEHRAVAGELVVLVEHVQARRNRPRSSGSSPRRRSASAAGRWRAGSSPGPARSAASPTAPVPAPSPRRPRAAAWAGARRRSSPGSLSRLANPATSRRARCRRTGSGRRTRARA